jgi:hypothetical protein
MYESTKHCILLSSHILFLKDMVFPYFCLQYADLINVLNIVEGRLSIVYLLFYDTEERVVTALHYDM